MLFDITVKCFECNKPLVETDSEKLLTTEMALKGGLPKCPYCGAINFLVSVYRHSDDKTVPPEKRVVINTCRNPACHCDLSEVHLGFAHDLGLGRKPFLSEYFMKICPECKGDNLAVWPGSKQAEKLRNRLCKELRLLC